MVVVCADSTALLGRRCALPWRICRGGAAAAAAAAGAAAVPLRPEVAPWTVALGVLQHTHPDHIACRECIVIAPVTSAGRSGDDQSSVRYFALAWVYWDTCVRAPVRINTRIYSYSGVCVC